MNVFVCALAHVAAESERVSVEQAEAASEKMKISETLCNAIAGWSDMFQHLLSELNSMFSECTGLLDKITRKKLGFFNSKRINADSLINPLITVQAAEFGVLFFYYCELFAGIPFFIIGDIIAGFLFLILVGVVCPEQAQGVGSIRKKASKIIGCLFSLPLSYWCLKC